jgi:hypothetical protein
MIHAYFSINKEYSMHKRYVLLLFLFVLSIISGFLMSKASWVSRVGMSLFYRQYNFLKVWWKGGLAVFLVWMVFFGVQYMVQKKLSRPMAARVHIFACVLALTGLYFTYNDFRNTLSHNLLGERFHLGAYLFWIGWLFISAFFILERPAVSLDLPQAGDPDEKPGINI